MIGLLMLQLARIKGAAKLIMIEPVEEKKNSQNSRSGYCKINPYDDDVKKVLDENGIGRISTVIECVLGKAVNNRTGNFR